MGIALYRQEVRKIMRTSKGKYEAEKLLLYSKLSDEQAKAYVDKLKADNRYVRDIY